MVDILKRYREQTGWTPENQTSPAMEGVEGAIPRLVVRLTGGRVRDTKMVTRILLIVLGLFVIASLMLLVRSTSSVPDTRKNYVPAE